MLPPVQQEKFSWAFDYSVHTGISGWTLRRIADRSRSSSRLASHTDQREQLAEEGSC
jgi:hypothetical protein